MHRDNWNDVFKNQDKILTTLKPLENEIFLAGGTGLQRFVLPLAYRHSEDLDFFLPRLYTNNELNLIKNKVLKLIQKMPQAKLKNQIWLKDEKSWRMWFGFSDNDEIIKVEILNFTCKRIKDLSFIDRHFRVENLYNLLLYKFKALCDRPDTIKDIFDIYFILRNFYKIKIFDLIEDINKKFEKAIGIKYSKNDIIKSLNHNLDWDIEIGSHVKYLHDLKIEIELFQKELKTAFMKNTTIDFSYKTRIKKRANRFNISTNEYIEYIEENQFLVNEWKRE